MSNSIQHLLTFLFISLLTVSACGSKEDQALDEGQPIDLVEQTLDHQHEDTCFHQDDDSSDSSAFAVQKESDLNLVTPENADFGFSFDVEWVNVSDSWKEALEASIADIQAIAKNPDFYNSIRNVGNYTCIAGAVRDRTGTKDALEVADYIANTHVKVRLRTYYNGWSSAKGSTTGNLISFNRKYSASRHAALTNTLFHEMLHVAGFGHCGKNNPRTSPELPTSVPYMVGGIIESHDNQLHAQPLPPTPEVQPEPDNTPEPTPPEVQPEPDNTPEPTPPEVQPEPESKPNINLEEATFTQSKYRPWYSSSYQYKLKLTVDYTQLEQVASITFKLPNSTLQPKTIETSRAVNGDFAWNFKSTKVYSSVSILATLKNGDIIEIEKDF